VVDVEDDRRERGGPVALTEAVGVARRKEGVEHARVDQAAGDLVGVEGLAKQVLERGADPHPAALRGVEGGELTARVEAGQPAVQLEDPGRPQRQRARVAVDGVELAGGAEGLELEMLRRHW